MPGVFVEAFCARTQLRRNSREAKAQLRFRPNANHLLFGRSQITRSLTMPKKPTEAEAALQRLGHRLRAGMAEQSPRAESCRRARCGAQSVRVEVGNQAH